MYRNWLSEKASSFFIPNTLLVFTVTYLDSSQNVILKENRASYSCGNALLMAAFQADLKAAVACTECRNCNADLSSPNFIEY